MPNRRTVAIVATAAVLVGATSGAAAAAAGLRLPAMLVASGGSTPTPEVSVVQPDPTPRKAASPTATRSPSVQATTAPPPSAKPPVTRTKEPKPPRKNSKTEEPEPSKTPKPLPTETSDPGPEQPTKFVTATFGPDPQDSKPGHKVKVDVPDGWDPVKTGTWKRDFRDPTKQLTLRVWGVMDFGAATVDQNAKVEYEKRKALKDFDGSGILSGQWEAEDGRMIYFDRFSYSWTEDGRTLYASEWYPTVEGYRESGGEVFPFWLMVGAVGTQRQTVLLEPAMYRALESYTDYPVDP